MSSTAAAAAAAAGLSLHARLMQGFSSQQQQPAQPAAAHVGHNTAAAAAGYNLSHVSTTGNPSTANVAISSNSRLTGSGVSAGPAAAPAVSTVPSVVPGTVPSVCSLRVLDVSRCKALAGGAAGAAVYKLFQASLGAMPQLEGGLMVLGAVANGEGILPESTAPPARRPGPKGVGAMVSERCAANMRATAYASRCDRGVLCCVSVSCCPLQCCWPAG